jgi:ubiquinol-cytochrome c reductase cytochrome b subunit
MFSAILILLVMPFTDLSRSRGIQFKPLSKAAFFVFVGNFLILMELGAKHVESPFIEFGQISTVIYFAHFLIIVPLISLFENSLIELAGSKYKAINNNMYKTDIIIMKSVIKPSLLLGLALLTGIFTIVYLYTDVSVLAGTITYCDAPRP